MDPDFAIGYFNTVFALLYLNRPAAAEELLRRAAERGIETVEFSLSRYFIAFLRNDNAAMEREVAQRGANTKSQGWFEHQQAATLAYQGRLAEAKQVSEHGVTLARQGGLSERAAVFSGARAVWSAFFGLDSDARLSAVTALSLARGRDVDYGPAFALALLGDAAQVHSILKELEQRFPEDTSVQFSYLPALRGLDALRAGDAAKAIEGTQAAVPYELAVPGSAYISGASFFGALYPVYVRGLAYRQLGKSREAVVQFQKILQHPGITLNDAIGPMARLQLARALSDSGDRKSAVAMYEELFSIWKNADAGIPVIEQAWAERGTIG